MLSDGKTDDEARAAAFSFALRRDGASVQLDDLPDDRQAETEADLLRFFGIALMESLEDVWEEIGCGLR